MMTKQYFILFGYFYEYEIILASLAQYDPYSRRSILSLRRVSICRCEVSIIKLIITLEIYFMTIINVETGEQANNVLGFN